MFTIITILAGITFGGLMACMVCAKETYDPELVCWGKMDN